MADQPLIETPDQIRLRSAIQRTITESPPHVAATFIHLMQCIEQIRQQLSHVPRLAQALNAVIQVMPRYRCANGHDTLDEPVPYWQGIECSACGELALLQNVASAEHGNKPPPQQPTKEPVSE